jgi:hypothetical protein
MSEAGAAVACADIDRSTAEEVAGSLEGKAIGLETNVSDGAQVPIVPWLLPH